MSDATAPRPDPVPETQKIGSSTDPAEAERLRAIVEQCLERYETEGEAVIAAACLEHPQLAAKIKKRLDTLRGAGLLAGNAPEADRPPERLGEFRLLQRLGAGGMGVVYLAEQSSLGRTVALKLVRPENLFFPGARERFQREVEAVSRLQHPGIVQVFAVGEAQGVPYFAMEHVRGCSLASAIAQLAERKPEELTGRDLLALCCAGAGLPMPEEGLTPPVFHGSWVQTCARVVQQVAQALQHAHGRGILHRDVKPSNVIVAPDGRVVLLDFGLARSEGVTKLTRSGAVLGSLHYVAPEQLKNPLGVDARTDVYSLGVTFYELLTLRAPYDASTSEALQALIQVGEAVPLRDKNPAVPWDAETICLCAMDRDPTRRYPSALDLARDLGNFLNLLPTVAKRPGAGLRLRRWTQRHPAKATALLLGAVVALFGPVVFGLQQMAANREIGAALAKVSEEQKKTHAALAEARNQQALSMRNLEKALDAVNSQLTRFAEGARASSPELDGLRRDLLAQAVSLLDQLDKDNPGDDKLQMNLAMAHKRCGGVYRTMGQHAEARRSFERALVTFERMHAIYPDREMIVQLAGSTLNSLGACASEVGDHTASRAAFERARSWMTEARAKNPADLMFANELAAALLNLAVLHQAAGEAVEGGKLYDEALTIRRDLVARFPTDHDLPFRLASLLSSRGRLYRATRQFEKARADFEECKQLLQPLTAGENEAAEPSVTLAMVHQYLAVLDSAEGRRDDARASLQAAQAVWNGLIARFTERPLYRMALATVDAELADHYDDEPKRELLDRAVELGEGAFAKSPSSDNLAKLGQIVMKRGRTQLGLDDAAAATDLQRAVELLSRWLAERPEDPNRLVQIVLAEHHFGRALHAQGDPPAAFEVAQASVSHLYEIPPAALLRLLTPAMVANIVTFTAGLSFEAGDRAASLATLRLGFTKGAVGTVALDALVTRGQITVAEREAIVGAK